MNDCIFCKIASGEIPTEKVFENESCLAFLDAHPHSKGHTLVIPKEHYANLLVTPEDLRSKLMQAVAETAEVIKEKYDPSGMNITSNIGKSAGQVIFHTHIHIIPRYGDKGTE